MPGVDTISSPPAAPALKGGPSPANLKRQEDIEGLQEIFNKPSPEKKKQLPTMEEARDEKIWRSLSQDERLTYCDPEVVKQEMQTSLRLRTEPTFAKFPTGATALEAYPQLMGNAHALLEAYGAEKHLGPEYKAIALGSITKYVDLIRQGQVDEGPQGGKLTAEAAQGILRDVIDKLVYQNKESMKRSLGDHGVRHIVGNIDEAMKIADAYDAEHPSGGLTAKDRLKIMTVHYNHDFGYTVGINREGFVTSNEHPAYSEKLFAADQRIYASLFPDPKDMAQMRSCIKTHDQEMVDFKDHRIESIVRLSDNLALFHDAKLPEFLYAEPANVAVLQKISIVDGLIEPFRKRKKDAEKEKGALEAQLTTTAPGPEADALHAKVATLTSDVDRFKLEMQTETAKYNIDGLKEEMVQNIEMNPMMDDDMKTSLKRAVGEINLMAPKFNIGMFAGRLDGYKMQGEKLTVRLRKSAMFEQIQSIFPNLSQAQFLKLLDSYKEPNIKDMTFEKLEAEGRMKVEGNIKYIEIQPKEAGGMPLRFEFDFTHPPKDPQKAMESERDLQMSNQLEKTRREHMSILLQEEFGKSLEAIENPATRSVTTINALFDAYMEQRGNGFDGDHVRQMTELRGQLTATLTDDAAFTKVLTAARATFSGALKQFLKQT